MNPFLGAENCRSTKSLGWLQNVNHILPKWNCTTNIIVILN